MIDFKKIFRNDFVPEDGVIDPQLVHADDDLTNDQLFRKYVPQIFPVEIGKQIMKIYPHLKCDKHKQMKEFANKSLIIFGGVGTGKSFMSCMLTLFGASPHWFLLSFHVKFITVPDLLTDVRRLAVTGNKEITETGKTAYDEYIHRLKMVRYLILDDLGTEKSTDFANSVLDNIVDHRYQKPKARHTIITTNLSIEDLEADKGQARIIDRINHVGEIVELTKRYRKDKMVVKRMR